MCNTEYIKELMLARVNLECCKAICENVHIPGASAAFPLSQRGTAVIETSLCNWSAPTSTLLNTTLSCCTSRVNDYLVCVCVETAQHHTKLQSKCTAMSVSSSSEQGLLLSVVE